MNTCGTRVILLPQKVMEVMFSNSELTGSEFVRIIIGGEKRTEIFQHAHHHLV